MTGDFPDTAITAKVVKLAPKDIWIHHGYWTEYENWIFLGSIIENYDVIVGATLFCHAPSIMQIVAYLAP